MALLTSCQENAHHATTFTILIILSVFSILCVHRTQAQCLTADDTRMSTNSRSHQALYRGQQDFSLTLLHEINKQSAGTDNIIFSPYSAYHALLVAYFLAANQTEKSVHRALRLGQDQDKVDVLQAYRFDKLRRTPYEFSGANRIYVDSSLHIRDCMEDLFSDELQKLNFAKNPDAALDTINSWVEEQTRGMIRNLLPPSAINNNTNLVVANAAFFKGLWEYQFSAKDTNKTLFYVSPSENTIVDMMTQEGTFNHDVSETLGAHILQMPYKGGSASMYILLPPFTSKNGVENVLAKLNSQTFADIVAEGSLIPRRVQVSVPRFALERTVELGPALENMGVGDLLTTESDLSLLTGVKNQVSLGAVIHKARIEVTEEGTKAAAATALFTFRSSRPAEPAQFNCNHPFVYVIYDRQNQAILFAGIFRRP